jgi:hypothetical protein
MSSPSRQAAETLSALETLKLRTLAAAHRYAWTVWLFWAAAYLGSVPVFLAAPEWAIGLYWLCVAPVAIAATLATSRRMSRREGVVPIERSRAIAGWLGLTAVCFLTGPVSPLGPALALAVAIVVFGWVWPRRLALALAGLLASTAVVLVLLLEKREAAAAIAATYAAVFIVYALYERKRLIALL